MRILSIIFLCIIATTFSSELCAQVRYNGWYNNPFYRSNDSVFTLRNGILYFAFKDSVGTPTDTTHLSDRIDARVKYTDSLTKFVTPKQLADTATILHANETKFVTINSDVSTSSISFVDITDLKFPVLSGETYWFRFVIFYATTNAGRGSAWAINGPTLTATNYRAEWSLSTTTRTFADGLTAYNATTSNATSATTGANMTVIEGIIQCAASGDVIARMLSGAVSSTITAKKKSFIQYKKL